MLVRELLAKGAATISRGAAGESAWLDATILWAACLGVSRDRILASLGEAIPDDSCMQTDSRSPSSGKIDFTLPLRERFLSACERRATGYPIAYLTGRKEFFGRDFVVDESVLIPRPETELLVEWVLETLVVDAPTQGALGSGGYRMHDCCTGSGCIPISLGLEIHSRFDRRSAMGVSLSASDLSARALFTAEKNATALAPQIMIEWLQGDLLEGFLPGSIDLLTANPPYVPHHEACGQVPQSWSEPAIALDGGPDGLDLIRLLVAQASTVLRPHAWFFMEFGDGQSTAIVDILNTYGFESPEIRCDLAGLPRMVRVRQSGA